MPHPTRPGAITNTIAQAAASAQADSSSTTLVSVTGATLTVGPGIFLITGTFELQGSGVGDVARLVLDVDGTPATLEGVWEVERATSSNMVTLIWGLTIAGPGVLVLQIARTSGAGTVSALTANTNIAALRVA